MLAEAKSRLPHARFLPWIEQNLEISARQCQKYMRAASRWKEIEASNANYDSHLTLEDGLRLIAKPRPEPERRTSKEPRPGRLPAQGHRLTASLETNDGEIKVIVEPHIDEDFVYLTAIDESGVADIHQKPVRQRYAYFILEFMRPDIEFDTLEWSEEPAEPRSGGRGSAEESRRGDRGHRGDCTRQTV